MYMLLPIYTFSHANILTFEKDGKRVRPFDSMEEHNEHIVDNWNKTVRDCDIIYVCGDVLFAQETGWPALERLRGKKHLIEGNHDPRHIAKLVNYFVSVRAMKIYNDLIFTHIPIHSECVDRFNTSVHGHLHNNFINDPRYLCISMEQINFTPISIDEIRQRIVMNRNSYDETGLVVDWTG